MHDDQTCAVRAYYTEFAYIELRFFLPDASFLRSVAAAPTLKPSSPKVSSSIDPGERSFSRVMMGGDEGVAAAPPEEAVLWPRLCP